MLRIGVGHSTADDSTRAGGRAAREALEEAGDASVVFVFCSTEHDYDSLLAAVDGVFESPIVGCSTAGEIVDTGSYTESAVVIALGGDAVRAGVGASDYEDGGRSAGRDAATAALDDLDASPLSTQIIDRDGDGWQSFDAAAGVLFADHADDNADVAEGMAEVVGPMSVNGGWAGDDWKDDGSGRVFRGSEPLDAATVFAALDLDVKSGVALAHGLETSTREFTITDGGDGVVRELDGRPAYEVYADLFGDRIETPAFLFTQPVSVEVDEDESRPLLPYRAEEETGTVHFDGPPVIEEGRRLRIIDPRTEDILDSAEVAIDRALERAGDPDDVAAVLLHDCGCRWYHLSDTETRERELDVIRDCVGPDVPIAGWYTAGELVHPDPRSGYHKESMVAWTLTNEPL